MTYAELHRLLRRCSERDRKRVLDLFVSLEAQANREDRECADLRIVVRDQRNHIRNLEAQLLPYLQAPKAEQEAML